MGSESICYDASHSHDSGYIYTNFQKTAKIWWDPWMGGDGAIWSTIDGSGSGYPIAEVNNCSRVIKYVVTLGQRYSTYSLVDMRVHDINVVADLARHDPTAPDPEAPVVYDGTKNGVSEAPGGQAFTEEYQQTAHDALSCIWLAPWPTMKFTCNLVMGAVTFLMVFFVDILGTLTAESCSFSDSVISTMSDAEFEESVGRAVGLTTIQSLTIIVAVSLTVALLFSTFQLLPHAKLAFTIAVIVYTAAALLLIYAIADGYLRGSIRWEDAAAALFSLTWAIIFGGNALSGQSIFLRVFSCLKKYAVDTIEPWGYHDAFLKCARVLLLLLGFAVMAAILIRR